MKKALIMSVVFFLFVSPPLVAADCGYILDEIEYSANESINILGAIIDVLSIEDFDTAEELSFDLIELEAYRESLLHIYEESGC